MSTSRVANADEAAVLERFRLSLVELRALFGDPGYGSMGHRVRAMDGVVGSKSSFQRLMTGPLTRLPPPDQVRGFVAALGGSPADQDAWERRRWAVGNELQTLRERSPGEGSLGADRTMATLTTPPDDQGRDNNQASIATDDSLAARQPAEVAIETLSPSPDRRFRRRLGLRPSVIVSLVALLVLSVALAILVGLPRSPGSSLAVTVTGTISCSSGAKVTGLYVETGRAATAGFASFYRRPGRPDIASYSYSLPSYIPYAVHVGCGGTRRAWTTDNRSSDYSGHSNSFICDDRAALTEQSHYGSCRHFPS